MAAPLAPLAGTIALRVVAERNLKVVLARLAARQLERLVSDEVAAVGDPEKLLPPTRSADELRQVHDFACRLGTLIATDCKSARYIAAPPYTVNGISSFTSELGVRYGEITSIRRAPDRNNNLDIHFTGNAVDIALERYRRLSGRKYPRNATDAAVIALALRTARAETPRGMWIANTVFVEMDHLHVEYRPTRITPSVVLWS